MLASLAIEKISLEVFLACLFIQLMVAAHPESACAATDLESQRKTSVASLSKEMFGLEVRSAVRLEKDDDRLGEYISQPSTGYSINDGVAILQVSLDASTIYDFRYNYRENPYIDASKNIITNADEAFCRILPILKRLKLPCESQGYGIDHPRKTDPEQEWHISLKKPLEYDGVPCLVSLFVLRLNAAGFVSDMTYSPVRAPDSVPSKEISKETAVGDAQEYIKKVAVGGAHNYIGQFCRGGVDPNDLKIVQDKVTRVIAYEPNMFSECLRTGDLYSTVRRDKVTVQYCWQVTVILTQDMVERPIMLLWVNTETGRVIGGI